MSLLSSPFYSKWLIWCPYCIYSAQTSRIQPSRARSQFHLFWVTSTLAVLLVLVHESPSAAGINCALPVQIIWALHRGNSCKTAEDIALLLVAEQAGGPVGWYSILSG